MKILVGCEYSQTVCALSPSFIFRLRLAAECAGLYIPEEFYELYEEEKRWNPHPDINSRHPYSAPAELNLGGKHLSVFKDISHGDKNKGSQEKSRRSYIALVNAKTKYSLFSAIPKAAIQRPDKATPDEYSHDGAYNAEENNPYLGCGHKYPRFFIGPINENRINVNSAGEVSLF